MNIKLRKIPDHIDPKKPPENRVSVYFDGWGDNHHIQFPDDVDKSRLGHLFIELGNLILRSRK